MSGQGARRPPRHGLHHGSGVFRPARPNRRPGSAPSLPGPVKYRGAHRHGESDRPRAGPAQIPPDNGIRDILVRAVRTGRDHRAAAMTPALARSSRPLPATGPPSAAGTGGGSAEPRARAPEPPPQPCPPFHPSPEPPRHHVADARAAMLPVDERHAAARRGGSPAGRDDVLPQPVRVHHPAAAAASGIRLHFAPDSSHERTLRA